MDWLQLALENLRKAKEGRSLSEADTKRLIIEPLLAWIGYEPWTYGRIWEEYSVKSGSEKERPDYALMDGNEVYMLLEAKALGQPLEQHVEKVATYCYHERVRFGILTDGERWILVDSEWKWDTRKVLAIKVGEAITSRVGQIAAYEALKIFHPIRKAELTELVSKVEELHEKGLKSLEVEILSHAYLVDTVKTSFPPASKEATRSQLPFTTSIADEPVWYSLFKAYVEGKLSKSKLYDELKARKEIGGQPNIHVCIGGKRVFIGRWIQLLEETVEWLIYEGKIKGPIPIPGRRSKGDKPLLLVNTKRENPASKAKNSEKHWKALTNGMWLWKNFSTRDILVVVADLLKQFGYDPLEVVRPC